ncbi:nucleotide-binding universal stress UspA family protein [Kitasatospora sp. MAA19]|uniref:universal stress protein n=1 Tax=Kitasatospora sp. MAA19 TaxID=3035090 RepID=UPI0024737305|nr:universal stress protein [Kitasatospora sp. MAA19]MDH6707331.1 nucleotide-binding universal stress UspA family protein [Kitasatospora sp. MAA19]
MTGTTRVIVGLSGSLSSLAALYHAVGEAARHEAVLVPVAAWTASERDGLRPLSELEHAARRRLDIAFEQAYGGYPAGLVIHPLVVNAEPGPALVGAVTGPADLLVLGAATRRRLDRLRHGSVARHCRHRAGCPVVEVSPSALLTRLELPARTGAPLPLLGRV